MPTTAEICQTSGIYQADCRHATQIALSRGERFPPCSHCHRAITWRLIQATK